jgi:hypothetical protein
MDKRKLGKNGKRKAGSGETKKDIPNPTMIEVKIDGEGRSNTDHLSILRSSGSYGPWSNYSIEDE